MIAIVMGLAWGSFLNMIAYRSTHDNISFRVSRSCCPRCHRHLQPWELVPVLSWLLLQGKCSSCRNFISPLYPFIEIITAISMVAVTSYHTVNDWEALLLISSALIITIRTDLECMLINRFCTIGLLPIIFLLSVYEKTPTTFLQATTGALLGYLLLKSISLAYYWTTGRHGMGDGDPELMAFIGSAVGPLGVMQVLAYGSVGGTLIALCWLGWQGDGHRHIRFPFGAALALAALYQLLIANHQI